MNHATNTDTVTSAIDYQSSNNSTISKETNNLKKHSISIFHVKAEFDGGNNKQETGPVQNIHIHKYPHFIGFRDYIHGVRKGIESGLNHFIHKDKYYNMNEPNGMAGPVLFFNKFHNRASDVATNVHRALFGHKF